MRTILFVCTGNTCRSPMAEIILKSKFKEKGITDIAVKSAGLSVEEGSKISVNSRTALKKLGLKASGFRPKQLTEKMLKNSDLVLCMTENHKRALKDFKNIYTIAEATETKDISDPYGMGIEEYVKTSQELNSACDIIVKKILTVKGELK